MKFTIEGGSVNPEREALRESIKEQIAAFVKDGGKIEQVPPGALKGWVNLVRQYPEAKEVA